MRCMFCNHEIMKKDDFLGKPISIPSLGIAHTTCAERDLVSKRIFGSIHLTEVSMDDLYELRELVVNEINDRIASSHAPEEE